MKTFICTLLATSLLTAWRSPPGRVTPRINPWQSPRPRQRNRHHRVRNPCRIVPEVNLLDAARDGLISVQAEAGPYGRMTVSITNRSRRPLR